MVYFSITCYFIDITMVTPRQRDNNQYDEIIAKKIKDANEVLHFCTVNLLIYLTIFHVLK